MPFSKNMKEKIKDPEFKDSIEKNDDLEIEFGNQITDKSSSSNINILNVYLAKSVKTDFNPKELQDIQKKLSEEFKKETFEILPSIKVFTTKKDLSINNNILDKYQLGSEWYKNNDLLNFLKAFSKNYKEIKEQLSVYLAPVSSNNIQTDVNDKKNFLKEKIIDSLNENLKNLFESKFKSLDYWPTVFIEGSSLNVRIASFYDYKVNNRNYESQGTGIRNLLLLILMLEKNKDDESINHLYLIDELEDGLTINIQEEVLNYFYEFIKNHKNITIIYTTHSPNLLPKFNKIDEMSNIIICYRKKNNSKDNNEISGELLTFTSNNLSDIDKTQGFDLCGSGIEIKSNDELMKWCLDLNEENFKKIENQNNKIDKN